MQQPKLIFIHTPRTAGGTINHMFRSNYPNGTVVLIESFFGKPEKNILVYYPKPRYKIYKIEQVRKFSIITGHIPFSRVVSFNRPLITWLRHPVDRVISHYNVVKSSKRYMTKFSGIISFAESTPNLMTYFTGGDLSRFSFIGIQEFFEEDLKRMFKVLGIPEIKYENKHKSKRHFRISEREKEGIIKVNNKDMKLYREALIRNERTS